MPISGWETLRDRAKGAPDGASFVSISFWAGALYLAALLFSPMSDASAEDSIWTTKPVRVDPARQNYERLSDRVMGLDGGERVSLPVRIEMHDSTSFSANAVEYVLADLQPIAANRLCQAESGARWPCGLQARIFASNLLRSRSLTCKVQRSPDKVALSGCRDTRINIALELVSNGHAFPASDGSELDVAREKAKAKGAGVWRDIACIGADQTC